MGDAIEAQIRRVVARHLGVAPRSLEPDVSLVEDAGGGSAIHDLVFAVERRLDVHLHERVLDEVRSYGELVAATVAAIRARREQLAHQQEELPSGRVRITGGQGLVVERSGVLTPYLLEGICDDARRAGNGAELVATLAAATSDEQLARVRRRLGTLERRGVAVRVVRGPDAPSRLKPGS